MTHASLNHNLPEPLQRALGLLARDTEWSLSALAREVGWSPAHLQKQFKQALGVTPAEFARAQKHQALRHHLSSVSVTRSIVDAGYGSTSRVYENTQLLGMTPGQFARGGKGLTIAWSHVPTALGPVLAAATERGVCAVLLEADERKALEQLQQEFPLARLEQSREGETDFLQPRLDSVARYLAGKPATLDVHLLGTAFQVRVWEALMKVPRGTTLSYQQLATNTSQPTAVRATASSCARNRLAIVVPCHRIVRGDGSLGGYRWGLPLKETLLEAERTERLDQQSTPRGTNKPSR